MAIPAQLCLAHCELLDYGVLYHCMDEFERGWGHPDREITNRD